MPEVTIRVSRYIGDGIEEPHYYYRSVGLRAKGVYQERDTEEITVQVPESAKCHRNEGEDDKWEITLLENGPWIGERFLLTAQNLFHVAATTRHDCKILRSVLLPPA
ncbi:hypothetical protein J8F10_31850 [Gemmata sp. G18]|uniref:PLAT domain-containing protein n=1 Tax=Gemmata palustris TaxID=2822762 RepID=A0ABS5C1J7_9BACT|nr:hypothetical protein [Gemmata palustris]MBP3959866.1 hypothetical protein [Gemmata palustris]